MIEHHGCCRSHQLGLAVRWLEGPAICPVVRRHPAHSIESSGASVQKGRPVDRLADLITVREKDEVSLTFKLVQRRVGEQLR